MTVGDFKTLNGLNPGSPIVLKRYCDYADLLVEAKIPYQPGVYLVYSMGQNNEDDELLYYGKAGVTANGGVHRLNFHQLPARLVAVGIRPLDYPFSKEKFVSRAKLWPWYVDNIYHNGIRIYWYITEWPAMNPVIIEKEIKKELAKSHPSWKKKI